MSASYLIRRRGIYHFRIRVPQDVQTLIGKKEIHQSLRTRDARLARSMAVAFLHNSTTAFTTARHHLLLGFDVSQVRQNLLSTITGRTGHSLKSSAPVSRYGSPYSLHSETCLSTLIEKFIEDRKAAWSPKTLLQNSSALRQFLSIVGDKPIADINRKDCRAYRDLLRKLPPNATKRFRNMSLERVVALGEPPMSPKNVNRVLGAITAFFNWAVREEFIEHNPTRALGVPITRRADTQRDVFSQRDLRIFFEKSPLYRGCESPERRHLVGELVIRDAKFWLPLVALYSGMRLEEVAQLRIEDIRRIDKIWLFDVNAKNGNKLKTEASQRYVPIHSVLCEIGFLEHIARVRNIGGERLWPDLEKGSDGYFSSTFSKWFSRYKRKIGITNSRVTFLSFRHTVINHLKQSGVSESEIKELVGHKDSSITLGRYGKRYEPRVLFQIIEKLNYCLDHLSLSSTYIHESPHEIAPKQFGREPFE